MAIERIVLDGHGNLGFGVLALTRRRFRATGRERFPQRVKDNLFIVTGTDLTTEIESFEIVYDDVRYKVLILDAVLVASDQLHVWAAALKKHVATVESESNNVDKTFGVGAITITIVTSDDELVQGQGTFASING